MPITNGYCTLAEFKAYADITTTDATDDAFLEDAIEAASRLIDAQTRRHFYAATETRYFDVPAGQVDDSILYLDEDLLAITTLTNGSSGTTAAASYRLLPPNASPKWGVKLRPSSGLSWDSDTAGDSEQAISIAGTWGYSSTTPDDIKQACLLIANAYRQKRSGQSVEGITRVTGAGVVIEAGDIPKDAARLIQGYKKVF
jgi:hypothetical protein